MSRSLLLAALGSAFLHAALLWSFTQRPVAPAAVVPPVPTLEVILAPAPAAEPVPVAGETAPASPAPVEPLPRPTAPPSLRIDSTFVQSLQPPAVPVPSGTTVPLPAALAGHGTGGDGTQALFDLASLDQAFEALVRVPPVYPEELRREGLNGSVRVSFIVDAQGNVQEPHILEASHHGFEAPALQAISQWKFRPGKKDGRAVSTLNVQQTFNFTLSDH